MPKTPINQYIGRKGVFSGEGLLQVLGQGTPTLSFDPIVTTSLGRIRTKGVGSLRVVSSNTVSIACSALGLGSADAFLRVNDEANVFLNLTVNGICEVRIGTDGSGIGTNVMLSAKASGKGTLCDDGTGSGDASNSIFNSSSNEEESVIHFMIDITQEVPFGRYRQYKCKFTLNGEKVPIASFSFTKSSLSSSFTARLADLSQRTLFDADEVNLKFEIGEVLLDGDIVWRTMFDTSRLEQTSYSVGMSDQSPTDTFNFTSIPMFADKMKKAPINTEVYYDPTRITVTRDEIEAYYDEQGRRYLSQVIPIAGLSLNKLFTKVAEQCDFDQILTNIPNYPLKRVDFDITQSYFEALKSKLGMFDVRYSANDDNSILYIRNVTQAIPSGFPEPQELLITNYRSLDASHTRSNVIGLQVQYIGSDREAVFRVQRFEQGDLNDLGNGYSEQIDETFYDVFSVSFPESVIRTEPYLTEKYLYKDSDLVAKYTARYTLNSELRPTSITKTHEAMLPSVMSDGTINEDLPFSLKLYKTETTQIKYSTHPYISKALYQAEVKTKVLGLIAVDSENKYLKQDYKQDFQKAHEAGVLLDGMLVVNDNIEEVVVKYTPQKNGQLKSEIQITNYLRDYGHTPEATERAGQGALSQAGEIQQKLLVKLDNQPIRAGDRIEPFNIGELPIYLGLPIAKQRLRKMRFSTGEGTADLLGLIFDVTDGSTLHLKTRFGESKGYVLVNSVTFNGNNLGTDQEILSQSIQFEELLAGTE